jgi:hypothetical protein
MWAVLLPQGVNPIAVKYIHHIISYHIISYHITNLGTSHSWNPVGQSRPVMWLLYLYCSAFLRFLLVLGVSIVPREYRTINKIGRGKEWKKEITKKERQMGRKHVDCSFRSLVDCISGCHSPVHLYCSGLSGLDLRCGRACRMRISWSLMWRAWRS